MNKVILTPKLAEEIQDEIYQKMSAEKKVRITSQFFMLARVLKESKTILNNDAGRITHNDQ